MELTRMVAALRSRTKSLGLDEISEPEYVALDFLVKHGRSTVGEIQKELGVLPAQMSRMLRSLEDKDGRALVECSINPDDRRKVDVEITDAGRAVYQQYRAQRLEMNVQFLKGLSSSDRDTFMRVVRSFREEISKRFS